MGYLRATSLFSITHYFYLIGHSNALCKSDILIDSADRLVSDFLILQVEPLIYSWLLTWIRYPFSSSDNLLSSDASLQSFILKVFWPKQYTFGETLVGWLLLRPRLEQMI
jgi:hypothetical protein